MTDIIHVGDAVAAKIVAGRPWASVPELRRIRGIGASRLYDIRTVGNACVDSINEHVLSGPIRVSDGDKIVVAGERVRLLGFDSPEQEQPCETADSDWACGLAATAALEALIDGHGVECRAPDRDRYRRWLAVCWRDDGLELNAEMVRLGWALAYRPSRSAHYDHHGSPSLRRRWRRGFLHAVYKFEHRAGDAGAQVRFEKHRDGGCGNAYLVQATTSRPV